MCRWFAWMAAALVAAPAVGMDLEERLACRSTIETARWAERDWPAGNGERPAPGTLVDASAIARQLGREAAQEQWLRSTHGISVDAALLQAEMDRMGRETRAPAALAARVAALDHDASAVAECIARPALVERLFLVRGGPADVAVTEPSAIVAVEAAKLQLPVIAGGATAPLPDTWESPGFHPTRSLHVSVWTGAEMLVWGGVDFPDADGFGGVLLRSGGAYDPAIDAWRALPVINSPSERLSSSAVWTGTELLVWGGETLFGPPHGDGSSYSVATDTWTPMGTLGDVPEPRFAHSAVWTGDRMLIWGGAGAPPLFAGGASYDPTSGTWTALGTTDAPPARAHHAAVWTGDRMLVWGGIGGGTSGASYEPVSGVWTAMSDVDAPAERSRPLAAWTGSELIVWGSGRAWNVAEEARNDGGRYDPVGDTWTPMSAVDAPTPRTSEAVWTGSGFFVWGGLSFDDSYLADGAVYDPVGDAWTALPAGGAPAARHSHRIISTGAGTIIWGGYSAVGSAPQVQASGARFDGAAWQSMAEPVPVPRVGHSAVWTGAEMIVWGGLDADGEPLTSGGAYEPATAAWRALEALDAPTARADHSAVWSGTEMLIWGGEDAGVALASGGAYDPLAGAWREIAVLDAPAARSRHTAIWTGEHMVVWGGVPASTSSARYSPAGDSWSAITDGPSTGDGHSAVWTGSDMLVFGGDPGVAARWNAGNDTWADLFVSSPPLLRRDHIAVWTGERMWVLGGVDSFGPSSSPLVVNPTAGTWEPSPGFWPYSRSVGAWSGTEILAWGGEVDGFSPPVLEGVRINALDGGQGLTMTLDGAPAARQRATSVWTGEQFLVWGGVDAAPRPLSGLGAYTPASLASAVSIDSFTPDGGQVIGLPYTVSASVVVDVPDAEGRVLIDDGMGAACQFDLPATSCDLPSSGLPGPREVRVRYSGDTLHVAATTTATYEILRRPITLEFIGADPPEGSFVGQPYFVAVNASAGAGGAPPTGSVTVDDGTGGSCSYNIATTNFCLLTSSTSGLKTLTATYPGDTFNAPASDTFQYLIVDVPLPDEIFANGFE